MRERPILFSAPMVQAILEGRKTQTRRVCKVRGLDFIGSGGRNGADWDDPDCWGYEADDGNWYVLGRSPRDDMRPIACPYGQPGDRLWVRETFAVWGQFRDGPSYCYRADGDQSGVTWQPSIHMSRSASRITLQIVGVRVERVQEIDAIGAMHEGIPAPMLTDAYTTLRDGFAQLWDSINAKRGYSWASNPYVWAMEFKRI